jgi:hypothetical protein
MEHDRIPELAEKLTAAHVTWMRAHVAANAADEVRENAAAAEGHAAKARNDAENELRAEIDRRAQERLGPIVRDQNGPRFRDAPCESC